MPGILYFKRSENRKKEHYAKFNKLIDRKVFTNRIKPKTYILSTKRRGYLFFFFFFNFYLLQKLKDHDQKVKVGNDQEMV